MLNQIDSGECRTSVCNLITILDLVLIVLACPDECEEPRQDRQHSWSTSEFDWVVFSLLSMFEQ